MGTARCRGTTARHEREMGNAARHSRTSADNVIRLKPQQCLLGAPGWQRWLMVWWESGRAYVEVQDDDDPVRGVLAHQLRDESPVLCCEPWVLVHVGRRGIGRRAQPRRLRRCSWSHRRWGRRFLGAPSDATAAGLICGVRMLGPLACASARLRAFVRGLSCAGRTAVRGIRTAGTTVADATAARVAISGAVAARSSAKG